MKTIWIVAVLLVVCAGCEHRDAIDTDYEGKHYVSRAIISNGLIRIEMEDLHETFPFDEHLETLMILPPASRLERELLYYSQFLKCYYTCNKCQPCSLGLALSICDMESELIFMDSVLVLCTPGISKEDALTLRTFYEFIDTKIAQVKSQCPVTSTCKSMPSGALREVFEAYGGDMLKKQSDE